MGFTSFTVMIPRPIHGLSLSICRSNSQMPVWHTHLDIPQTPGIWHIWTLDVQPSLTPLWHSPHQDLNSLVAQFRNQAHTLPSPLSHSFLKYNYQAFSVFESISLHSHCCQMICLSASPPDDPVATNLDLRKHSFASLCLSWLPVAYYGFKKMMFM